MYKNELAGYCSPLRSPRRLFYGYDGQMERGSPAWRGPVVETAAVIYCLDNSIG